jgi:sugar phosphate isomerase/epimerase
LGGPQLRGAFHCGEEIMRNITRRQFGQGIAAAALFPALISARSDSRRLPIAFSTLGCPDWDWRTILDQAAGNGYAAVELRGIKMEMDLPRHPQFTGDRLKESRKDLAALDLKVVNLGSSVNFHESEESRRRQHLDSGKAFIDLAHQLDCPYIRVFGDKYVEGEPREVTIDRIVKGVTTLADHAKGSGVTVLIESHGDFTDSPTLLNLLQTVNRPEFALLWDAHHTYAAAGESPEESFRQIGKFTRHIHLKDSRLEGESRRYVLTGMGDVPVKETVRVLYQGGYQGYYGFEWEKGWHRNIEEPEVAFPHYAKVIAEYLGAAGFQY